MKTMKNILKSRTLATLSALFAMAFVANVFSMLPEQPKNSYFIHDQDNPENGIWVDKELVKKNSKTINAMIEDIGEELDKIPLSFSFTIIKLGFDLLGNTVNISELSFEQLVDVANFFNFLDVPADTMKTVLVKIKENIDNSDAKNINAALKILNPDLQKLIMTEPSIAYLKDCIIKKYAKNRRKSLSGHPNNVFSVAFNFNGTKIVSGHSGNQDNLILWDVSNPDNIEHQTLVGHQKAVNAAAFSPDDTKIVSGSHGNQNNLIRWDISNPRNIVPKTLVGPRGTVFAVAFSRDGTKIAFGCHGNQNNLILWDISDPQNITQKILAGHPHGVLSVAFNSDSTKIVSGGLGNENNLILWNINDLHNITHQTLVNNPTTVTAVAFSPDDTKIVFGGLGKENNLILCDISDLQNIKSQPLVGHPDTVFSVAFSPDSTKIISGGQGEQNNLILWDISDPHNITHQTLVSSSKDVKSVAFSPDGTKIVFGCASTQNNLIILTLLTDQENTFLKQLKNYTTDQVRLIYQLCLQSLKGQKITLQEGSEEHTIFMTLPQDIQKLLTDLFSINITM